LLFTRFRLSRRHHHHHHHDRRSVANRLNEIDQLQQQQQSTEDVEMASIAEDELLNEKFSLQGTSTGKISGRKKVVSSSLRVQLPQVLSSLSPFH